MSHQKINNLRTLLSQDPRYQVYYDRIPNDLLLLAITNKPQRSVSPPSRRPVTQIKPLQSNLTRKPKPSMTNEQLEWLGDSIIGLLTRLYLYHKYDLSAHDYTRIYGSITSNKLFDCLSKSNSLCALSENPARMMAEFNKTCANMLEALIAAVYLGLKGQGMPDVLEEVWRWLNEVFHIGAVVDSVVEDYLTNGKIEDVCRHVGGGFESGGDDPLGAYLLPSLFGEYQRQQKVTNQKIKSQNEHLAYLEQFERELNRREEELARREESQDSECQSLLEIYEGMLGKQGSDYSAGWVMIHNSLEEISTDQLASMIRVLSNEMRTRD